MANKRRARPAPRRKNVRRAASLTNVGICVFLFAIVWVVFGQTLGHGFVNYDDDAYVYKNSRITAPLTWSGIASAFTHVHADNWHPLTTISHMLDYQLYGMQPWGHHLTNVLLHGATAIVLFQALLRLTARGENGNHIWPSGFVAALFAIHPLRVESVAWVSERKDVLSGLFFMLTLWAYARYARSAPPRSKSYLIVALVFALGLLCKPTLVTLPFVLLLLDYWPLGRFNGRDGEEGFFRRSAQLLIEKVPLLILSAASCVATLLAQKHALALARHLTIGERAGNAVLSYLSYLRETIYPAGLAVLYPYPEGNPKLLQPTVALLFLSLVTVLCFLSRKNYPYLLVGWLWFLGVLVPMIGLVQVGMQPRADRYTYLPQIGLAIMAAWGARDLLLRWPHGREIAVGLAVLILGTMTFRAHVEASYWRDSATLWQHALDNTTDNYIAENSAANGYLDKNEPGEAITHYRQALALKPGQPIVEGNLGKVLLRQGAIDEAMSHFEKALQLDAGSADALHNMGNALLRKGESNAAIGYYEKALQARPDFGEVYNNLAIALLRTGRPDAGIENYRKAIALLPQSADLQLNLGLALASQGRFEEAIAAYDKALQLRPDYAQAHYNLGNVLAQLGRRDEAAAQLRAALRLKPDYPDAAKRLREFAAPP